MAERDGERGPLREYLAARDARCPGCGYNLRGLTTDRCPECGTMMSLGAIREANLRLPLAWWVSFAALLMAAIAALCAGPALAVDGAFEVATGRPVGVIELAGAGFAAWLVALEVRWVRRAGVTARWPVRKLWIRAGIHWLLAISVLVALWALMFWGLD